MITVVKSFGMLVEIMHSDSTSQDGNYENVREILWQLVAATSAPLSPQNYHTLLRTAQIWQRES